MSIDALAMAGVDYRESGISFTEMEFRDMETTPQYLLAENEYTNGKEERKRELEINLGPRKLQLNTKMQPWRKVVGSARGNSGPTTPRTPISPRP